MMHHVRRRSLQHTDLAGATLKFELICEKVTWVHLDDHNTSCRNGIFKECLLCHN